MTPRIFLFSQPNCLSCEVVRMYLEIREIAFEERDISDPQILSELLDTYQATGAPAVVIITAAGAEVIEGFNPDRIDQCLSAA
jgi:arsenate reductase-like glutaredoxin family protein